MYNQHKSANRSDITNLQDCNSIHLFNKDLMCVSSILSFVSGNINDIEDVKRIVSGSVTDYHCYLCCQSCALTFACVTEVRAT